MGAAGRVLGGRRDPAQCVAGEIAEETSWQVSTGPPLDVWMYDIVRAERHVFIVTHSHTRHKKPARPGCSSLGRAGFCSSGAGLSRLHAVKERPPRSGGETQDRAIGVFGVADSHAIGDRCYLDTLAALRS
jgi:hypothetical protein